MERYVLRKENIVAAGLFLISFVAALLLDGGGYTGASCALLLCCAAASYCIFALTTHCLADLRGLMCLGWEGGLALAILRLSALHDEWTGRSRICFGGFILCFLIFSCPVRKGDEKKQAITRDNIRVTERLIYITCALSLATFIAEAVILGYVPAFSKDTHAYNYFHITGLHYFTVSSMMTHALTMIWLMQRGRRVKGGTGVKTAVMITAANVISATEAALCISKLQFMLICGLPVMILLAYKRPASFKDLPWKKIAAAGAGILILGVSAMVAIIKLRHYEPGYLNDIFEFRDPSTPMYIQYPYMYVANNFANFNRLTQELSAFTYGLRQAFPAIALTGLKFLDPSLVAQPLYVVKEELNTLTIIYDAYYDFGVAGVMGLGAVLGFLTGRLDRRVGTGGNPVWYLLYGQLALYFLLSFFSAWFTVTATWFWFALTCLYGLALKERSK